MGTTRYDEDVLAWAREQAQLLRSGRYAELDIEHLAGEIEDVGKSEQRELESRMAVLLAHLLKWQYQPERRGNSWRRTIIGQRENIAKRLIRTPSLKPDLNDPEWLRAVWNDALELAWKETGQELPFPESCPWTVSEILDGQWLPA
ncbi:DUF29 domain-containing protein [Plasticicumulans sp.]|uniref:DUF29 domain-containing protein n=1 Tax=Plasticicumulans sp. TaxID=2307179 RepID=UPI0039321831